MSLTIGRLTFNSPASIGTDEFGTFSFSGRLNNDSVDDMKYYRDEITSLASTLPTVPVSYTGDSTIDGYFQIIFISKKPFILKIFTKFCFSWLISDS